MRPDQRSPEAKAWRRFYSTKAWKVAKREQRAKQPLCERCLKRRFIVPMYAVNHRKPHKGDWDLFIDPANHESVCQPCHDGPIQSEEASGKINQRVGFSPEVDRDGWPIDPRHPANQTR